MAWRYAARNKWSGPVLRVHTALWRGAAKTFLIWMALIFCACLWHATSPVLLGPPRGLLCRPRKAPNGLRGGPQMLSLTAKHIVHVIYGLPADRGLHFLGPIIFISERIRVRERCSRPLLFFLGLPEFWDGAAQLGKTAMRLVLISLRGLPRQPAPLSFSWPPRAFIEGKDRAFHGPRGGLLD